jgi:alkylation response protein AidB-like acyl-CoA dehydrogenase
LGTLDFERITAEKLGSLAWLVEALGTHLAEAGRLEGDAWERLALLRGELDAARLLSLRAATVLDRGEPASAVSAMAKLAGARLAQRLANEAIDLLGLAGLRDGDPEAPLRGRIAALARASVGSTISGGTAEVQQLVIARRGLGLR